MPPIPCRHEPPGSQPECRQCILYNTKPYLREIWNGEGNPLPEEGLLKSIRGSRSNKAKEAMRDKGVDPVTETSQQGPGTELTSLLLTLKVSAGNCKCKEHARTMNSWGVEGCREHREEIIGWLREEAAGRRWYSFILLALKASLTSLPWKVDITDPIPGIVDEAIARAEEKESKKVVNTSSSTTPHAISWSYGVTTVARGPRAPYPGRRKTLLPRTLASLYKAGFPEPWLFVDGERDQESYAKEFSLPVLCHYPNIGVYGNWISAAVMLYLRNPSAARYMICQDDVVFSLNLKRYLELTDYPKNGYCNLYTFPENQRYAPKNTLGGTLDGWYVSGHSWKGLGALCLVFSQEAMAALLKSPQALDYLVTKPKDARGGDRKVDGAVYDAMKRVGYAEYVHSPSLVQHTGVYSSFSRHRHPLAESFRGENFDLLNLLPRGE